MRNARGRAGFVLANGVESEHFCSVKMVEDIRQSDGTVGLTESEALKKAKEAELKNCEREEREAEC